jgi:hypothetical protein
VTFRVPEEARVRLGPMKSTADDGNNGQFMVPGRTAVTQYQASDGGGWEHVSVTVWQVRKRKPPICRRTPTWAEMCEAKALFWSPEDVVIQFHPSDKQYVNTHPYCLHLWRQIGVELAVPLWVMV